MLAEGKVRAWCADLGVHAASGRENLKKRVRACKGPVAHSFIWDVSIVTSLVGVPFYSSLGSMLGGRSEVEVRILESS